MAEKLKSRKLWAAVVSAALTMFGAQLGVPPEATTWAVAIVVAYILGQSVVDASKAKADALR
jgi:hypothetical protein